MQYFGYRSNKSCGSFQLLFSMIVSVKTVNIFYDEDKSSLARLMCTAEEGSSFWRLR